MTKAAWQQHAKDAGEHDRKACPDCKARLRTKRAVKSQRERYGVMRDLGMVRMPYGWE